MEPSASEGVIAVTEGSARPAATPEEKLTASVCVTVDVVSGVELEELDEEDDEDDQVLELDHVDDDDDDVVAGGVHVLVGVGLHVLDGGGVQVDDAFWLELCSPPLPPP